jgi:hypothetical protein
MSTAERPVRITVPPLVEGQRLDQAEFHRRYDASEVSILNRLLRFAKRCVALRPRYGKPVASRRKHLPS